MTKTISKFALLMIALLANISVFAADGVEGDETKWQLVSRMPQFWIGVGLFVLFLTLGLMSGKNKKHQTA